VDATQSSKNLVPASQISGWAGGKIQLLSIDRVDFYWYRRKQKGTKLNKFTL